LSITAYHECKGKPIRRGLVNTFRYNTEGFGALGKMKTLPFHLFLCQILRRNEVICTKEFFMLKAPKQ
jgi:hypothetical protein